jgi:hypothetical protein
MAAVLCNARGLWISRLDCGLEVAQAKLGSRGKESISYLVACHNSDLIMELAIHLQACTLCTDHLHLRQRVEDASCVAPRSRLRTTWVAREQSTRASTRFLGNEQKKNINIRATVTGPVRRPDAIIALFVPAYVFNQ